jgi:hypothetical protein
VPLFLFLFKFSCLSSQIQFPSHIWLILILKNTRNLVICSIYSIAPGSELSFHDLLSGICLMISWSVCSFHIKRSQKLREVLFPGSQKFNTCLVKGVRICFIIYVVLEFINMKYIFYIYIRIHILYTIHNIYVVHTHIYVYLILK